MEDSYTLIRNNDDDLEVQARLLRDQRTSLVVNELVCATSGCGLSEGKSRVADAHSRSAAAKKLSIAVVLCVVFIVVEVVGGLISHSLAVLTDAAHLLSDVAGFAISLFAIWASSWEATPRQSYGYFRLEILGALLSIQIIWLLTGIIVYEAIYRMIHSSHEVDGRLMFIVAAFGFSVNVIMILLLGHHGHSHSHHGHSHSDIGNDEHARGNMEGSEQDHVHVKYGSEHTHDQAHDHDHEQAHYHHHDHPESHELHIATENARFSLGEVGRSNSFKVDIDIDMANRQSSKAGNINVRGAWLHVLGDLIQSIGVMVGGAIIWAKPGWKVVDLICTLLFSVIVLATTVKILRDIIEILMESTPREVDTKKLEKGLCDVPGVVAVHDLHIWAITMGKTLLACHVTIYPDANADAVLQKVISYCDQVFNISHVTFQIERQSGMAVH